jgi:hypothetical protein
MTPDLTLARTIAAAVMDRIERDRGINSEALTEAVFAELAWAAAKHPVSAAPPVSIGVAGHAANLVKAMMDWPAPHAIPFEVTKAAIDLKRALQREGLL